MPHDNRVTTSSTLAVSSVWKNVVKYDPYAASDSDVAAQQAQKEKQELLEKSRGLAELAKLSLGNTGLRATCKKCNGLGHLTYECRNIIGGKNLLEQSLQYDFVQEDAEKLDADAPVLDVSQLDIEPPRSHSIDRDYSRRRRSYSRSRSRSPSNSRSRRRTRRRSRSRDGDRRHRRDRSRSRSPRRESSRRRDRSHERDRDRRRYEKEDRRRYDSEEDHSCEHIDKRENNREEERRGGERGRDRSRERDRRRDRDRSRDRRR